MVEVLDIYEKESGQKINRDKTSLFFSKNTRADIQSGVKDMFGAQIVQQHEKYLGLPPMVGREKKKAFNRIKDQVSKKIEGWKGKFVVQYRKGSPNKGGCTSYSYLHHELLQAA